MIKLKILIVVHNFWPNFRAGTENATYFLARELSKKHDVTVLTVEPRTEAVNLTEEYVESGFKVIKIHQAVSIPENLKDTYFNKELENIFNEQLKKVSPDVVHFQHLIGLSLEFISIAKEKNIPIFYTLHDFWFRCPRIRMNYRGKNCSKEDINSCNSCILNNFLFINAVDDGHWAIKKAKKLIKKRFFKKITHTLLNQLRFKYLLNRKIKGIDLIKERNSDFMEYFSLVDQFISPSQFLKDVAVHFGLNSAKIDVLSHGIDNVKEKSREKMFASDGIVHFCFLSHITKDKGFFLLLDSFKKLLKKHKNVKLSLYGSYDKNDRSISKTLKSIKNNKHIQYRGVFSAENLENILSTADVVVIPSLWHEIYGLVLDEAFNFGVPVIVSNRGGLPERVTSGKNGLIFNPDKKNDLYEKMRLISKNPKVLEGMTDHIPQMKSIENYALEIEAKYVARYNKRNE